MKTTTDPVYSRGQYHLTPYPIINWLRLHRRATINPLLACILTFIWSTLGGFAYMLTFLLPFPDSEIGRGWLFYTGPVFQFMMQLLLLWGWWCGWCGCCYCGVGGDGGC